MMSKNNQDNNIAQNQKTLSFSKGVRQRIMAEEDHNSTAGEVEALGAPDAVLMDLDGLFGCERVNHGDPEEPFEWLPPKQKKSAAKKDATEENSSEEDGSAEAAKKAAFEKPVKLFLANGNVHLMAQHVWQSSITMAEEIYNDTINVKGKRVLEVSADNIRSIYDQCLY